MDVTLVGTNGSNYVITDATRTITITGLPAITLENLLYVYNTTQDLLYYTPTEGFSKASVSGGNVITIDGSFNVMAETDVLHVQLSLGELAYDSTIDANKDVTQNPDYSYRTSPELIGYTNAAAATYYIPIPWDTYRYATMFITASTGVGDQFDYSLWATNKSDVDLVTISETEWYDATSELTGSGEVNVPVSTASVTNMWFIDKSLTVEYLMLKVVVTGGITNTFGCYIKKSY